VARATGREQCDIVSPDGVLSYWVPPVSNRSDHPDADRDSGGSFDSDRPTKTKTVVTVIQPPASPTTPNNAAACLVIIYGADLGRRIVLDGATLEIGRSVKCDVSIDQESVSRKHARLSWDGSRYKLTDLGSTNGSYVNDELCTERYLKDGDQLKIGRTILKFMTGDNIETAYHEEIYRLMTFDGLTQIHNKRHFHDTLDREVSRSSRYERPMSLVVFDIDHFKKVNDTHGHLAGDALLRQLASSVRGRIRREDLFARVGGEEFAVLLPEIDLEGAVQFAEKIRKHTEGQTFHFEDVSISITLSLGVAQLRPPYVTGEQLYKAADAALYAAKQSGRNRVEIDPS
jgi:diguanylate cyclase (GGDEF)-like protein